MGEAQLSAPAGDTVAPTTLSTSNMSFLALFARTLASYGAISIFGATTGQSFTAREW